MRYIIFLIFLFGFVTIAGLGYTGFRAMSAVLLIEGLPKALIALFLLACFFFIDYQEVKLYSAEVQAFEELTEIEVEEVTYFDEQGNAISKSEYDYLTNLYRNNGTLVETEEEDIQQRVLRIKSRIGKTPKALKPKKKRNPLLAEVSNPNSIDLT